MKVLVCGSRHGFPRNKIKARLTQLPADTTVIEGEYEGVDLIARAVALELGLDVIGIPANWVRHKKAAGPIRNRRMLDMLEKEEDLVIAFHEDLANSKGTKDTVEEARLRGIKVEVIS